MANDYNLWKANHINEEKIVHFRQAFTQPKQILGQLTDKGSPVFFFFFFSFFLK